MREAFKFNTEIHLQPVLGLASNGIQDSSPVRHPPSLLAILTSQEVVSQELCLYDLQAPCLGGVHNEFIFSARLDNLCSTFCAMEGIIQASHNTHCISMVAMFDNEEVGSLSPPGADSTFVEAVIKRVMSSLSTYRDESSLLLGQGQGAVVVASPSEESNYLAVIARSLLISADMAHAAHPNYSDMHDELHRPSIGDGLVIKYNSNNRYATNLRSSALIKRVCKTASVPYQEFMTKNDAPCGTTIGPILSARLGMECVDVGIPQLSMHSIREMCGVKDVQYAIDCFRTLYSDGLPELKLSND